MQTVKKYHAEILEDLRENIVHKQWRNREARHVLVLYTPRLAPHIGHPM